MRRADQLLLLSSVADATSPETTMNWIETRWWPWEGHGEIVEHRRCGRRQREYGNCVQRAGSKNLVVRLVQACCRRQTQPSTESRVRREYSDQEGENKREENIGGPCSGLFDEEDVEDIKLLCEVAGVVKRVRLMTKRVRRCWDSVAQVRPWRNRWSRGELVLIVCSRWLLEISACWCRMKALVQRRLLQQPWSDYLRVWPAFRRCNILFGLPHSFRIPTWASSWNISHKTTSSPWSVFIEAKILSRDYSSPLLIVSTNAITSASSQLERQCIVGLAWDSETFTR